MDREDLDRQLKEQGGKENPGRKGSSRTKKMLLAAADDYNPGLKKEDIIQGNGDGDLRELIAAVESLHDDLGSIIARYTPTIGDRDFARKVRSAIA